MSASVSDTYGSAHLPECHCANQPEPSNHWHDDGAACEGCICRPLRACEQRVRTQEWANDNAYWTGQTEGYAAALDAAREALTEALNALPIRWTSDELFPAVLTIHQVFDALKEKP